jgi:hypothetical protein
MVKIVGTSSDEQFTMLHYACLDGYALAFGQLSFTGTAGVSRRRTSR